MPLAGAQEVEAALAGAAKAAPGWARTSAGDRSGMLKAAARALRDRVDEIAALQAREGGKPLGDSRGGVEAGIGTLEQYAELAPLHRGKALAGGWDAFDLMTWEPRGVAVVLTPWNDPAAIVLQGLGGALAAGNTVVFKPSERTPLCGALIASVLAEHLPPGVLQVLHGDGRTGKLLVEHPLVDVAYHVGSSVTGREIAQAAARTGAHAILEGGGKDACIVDAGVDPAWAAEQVALGAFANAGQICVSIERVYVHADVAQAFLDALVERAASFEIGPMVDERQRAVVVEHVSSAVAARRDAAGRRAGPRPSRRVVPADRPDRLHRRHGRHVDRDLRPGRRRPRRRLVRRGARSCPAVDVRARRDGADAGHGPRPAGRPRAPGRHGQGERGLRRGARRLGAPAPGERPGHRLRPGAARRDEPAQGRALEPAPSRPDRTTTTPRRRTGGASSCAGD